MASRRSSRASSAVARAKPLLILLLALSVYSQLLLGGFGPASTAGTTSSSPAEDGATDLPAVQSVPPPLAAASPAPLRLGVRLCPEVDMVVGTCYFWDTQEAQLLPEAGPLQLPTPETPTAEQENDGSLEPKVLPGEAGDVRASSQQGGGSPQLQSPSPRPAQPRLRLQPLVRAAPVAKGVMLLGLWELLLRPVVLWQPREDEVASASAAASARAAAIAASAKQVAEAAKKKTSAWATRLAAVGSPGDQHSPAPLQPHASAAASTRVAAIAASAKRVAEAAKKKTSAWATRPAAVGSSGDQHSPALLQPLSLVAASVAALLVVTVIASCRLRRGRPLFDGAGSGRSNGGRWMVAVPLVLKELPAKASHIGSALWQRLTPVVASARLAPTHAAGDEGPMALVVSAPAAAPQVAPPVFGGSA
eukprot:CAMPEP_0115589814 /NCGR_PEP_ID=MMETSP0272-20121206/9442_1 /TAXON_ID=71861 /ORGANISM="Scrippsiella trochoidea, Strain CCMP3099" /LENGTH=419 /DNA_ID=CAMNT_0003024989 /DNA_START=43 /DNA_END=1302 /DNA_ORIENTATION=+